MSMKESMGQVYKQGAFEKESCRQLATLREGKHQTQLEQQLRYQNMEESCNWMDACT